MKVKDVMTKEPKTCTSDTTLAEAAESPLPRGVTLDGRSFLPQVRGRGGNAREWVYMQLGDRRYVRNARWKLYGDGTLRDMKDAPYAENPVPAAEAGSEAARKRLQAILDRLKA